MADTREKALQDYRKKLLEHKEVDGRLKECRMLFYCDLFGVTKSVLFVLIRDILLDRQRLLAVKLPCALSCS